MLALTRRGLQILPFSGFGLRKAEKRVDGAACLTGGSIMVRAKCDIVPPANSNPMSGSLTAACAPATSWLVYHCAGNGRART